MSLHAFHQFFTYKSVDKRFFRDYNLCQQPTRKPSSKRSNTIPTLSESRRSWKGGSANLVNGLTRADESASK